MHHEKMHPDLENMLKQMGGSKDLLAEIVALFFEDCCHDLNVVQEALSRQDAQGIVAPAHGLKGELGNIGAQTAYKLALELEAAGKEGRLEEAKELLDALTRQVEELKRFFQRPGWQEKL